MVDAKNVTKTYGKVEVLHDLNLQLYRGEILGLLGPSGTGKSTIFKILTMMIARGQGSINVLGHDFREKQTANQLSKGQISIVYQDDKVLEPDLTVNQNL